VEDDLVVTVDLPLEPGAGLDEIVASLASPPQLPDRALRTLVADPPLVDAVEVVDGVGEVDLPPELATLSGDDQRLAVAQLVCTLTGQPGVGPVVFTLDGASIEVPRGDGSLTSGPVSRDDYSQLLG
jgi:spore germination protein GerM